MKKLGVWSLLLLVLGLASIYIFIPAKIKIFILTGAQATLPGEYRSISQEEKWELWWKDSNGKQHLKGEPFQYNETVFNLTKYGTSAAKIQIKRKGLDLASILQPVSFAVDSCGAAWSFEMPETYNPLTRLKYYNASHEIKNDMLGVMKNFSHFISLPKNIYGFEIYRTSTRDTILLSTKFASPDFPGTGELYKYFDILEKNIRKQNGNKTGYPMMNVVRQEDSSYETQIAIPTDRKLENDGNIAYRYMVPGNFYGADVRGGQYTVNEAQRQLNLFISDYKKSKMANAYQMLVTDRTKEQDTLKWITQLRIPVVE